MSEMVERVALAIANAKRAKHDITPCRWEHLTDEAKTEYVAYARAVIEAMREPNEEMIAKAMAPYLYGNDEAMNKAFRETIQGYW